MTQAQAFWLAAPGRGEIRTESLPLPGPDQVQVKTLYSGISRGTETLVFNGRVPADQYRQMRAPFQAGEFPAPVKYGYCNVGRVTQGPPTLRDRVVFCLYPHQTDYVVPAQAVTPLPNDLPPARAVLTANLETALNGLWDAAPRLGDRVSVVGAGTVGLLVAYLAARVPGCEVELLDICAAKSAAAAALGLTLRHPDQAAGDADLVIHASGSPAGLITALGLAGFEATVLELSWFGDRPATLALGGAFHSRRLRLCSSQVSHLCAAQRGRWDHRRRLATVLRLLADHPALDCIINAECRFSDLPQTLTRLAADTGPVLCQRVVY